MKKLKPTKRGVLVSFLIGLALAAGVISYLPKGGGNPIPTARPVESRRIHHPLGFSIIAPPDWTHSIRYDSINISSNTLKHGDSINVIAQETPPVLKEVRGTAIPFGGLNATIETIQSEDINGKGFYFSSIKLNTIKRNYEITYKKWGESPPDGIPKEILEYIHSFRED